MKENILVAVCNTRTHQPRMKVYRQANGLAHIERVGPCSAEWDSPDRTPEEWIAMHTDSDWFMPDGTPFAKTSS